MSEEPKNPEEEDLEKEEEKKEGETEEIDNQLVYSYPLGPKIKKKK